MNKTAKIKNLRYFYTRKTKTLDLLSATNKNKKQWVCAIPLLTFIFTLAFSLERVSSSRIIGNTSRFSGASDNLAVSTESTPRRDQAKSVV